MKQLILGFAACALIMTSCTQQEITENVTDGQGQLSFSTGLGKQSPRAAELMNLSLQKAASKENGVALRAYQEITPEGTFKQWYDDKLWYDQTAKEWKIESVRFRNEAKTKYITYFSKVDGLLSEVDEFANANFNNTFPQFTYKVNTASDNQEDLLAGVTEIPANQTNITLGMRHILSQVNFGTVGYKGANIAIRNIKIAGLYNSATYTYRAKDTYPIGDWGTFGTDGTPITRTATYNYFDYSNGNKGNNPQPVVPYTVESAGIYIFGDGGNWGPGKAATTFYPVGTDGAWTEGEKVAGKKLANSLMLMPQSFMAEATDAKVTFEYQITDEDNVFIAGAGGPEKEVWAKGEFKLNFTTGTVDGEHYLGKWDQNYRYIYLIDFTDFLDGNALTFDVDVEMYPWENYNGDGDDDGIVDIMAAGQPSATNMNSKDFVNDNIWYIATQSETSPTTPPTTTKTDWAQVIRDEVWNLSAYDFTQMAVSHKFNLSFQNVIFNTKEEIPAPTTITLTLPDGFSAALAIGSIATDLTISGTNPYTIKEGNRTAKAAITITNNYYYRTSATLEVDIEAVGVANEQKFAYGGKEAVDLRTMEPELAIAGNTITVKFISLVTPTVGVTANGTWAWDTATQTATWTRN